jgi:hypothetical protein
LRNGKRGRKPNQTEERLKPRSRGCAPWSPSSAPRHCN